MKKVLAILACVAIASGCGTTTPSWVSDVVGALTNAATEATAVTTATNSAGGTTTNVTATNEWHYTLFTDATDYEDSHGAASQMGYFENHNTDNENLKRIAMLQAVNDLGGNVNCYIRGSWGGSDVLSMGLCGRSHPDDGHYWPINTPTADSGEVDWAMWAAQDLGITHHLCWVLNDDTSMPITRDTFAKAVSSYTGSRLGAENIGYGVCLEASEIMSAAQAAQCLAWIAELAPASRAYVGASPTDFLISVWEQSNCPRTAYFWIEVDVAGSKNPITDPVSAADVQTRAIDKADRLVAAGIPKSQVVIGEIWSLPADRAAVTQAIMGAGYACSGVWK